MKLREVAELSGLMDKAPFNWLDCRAGYQSAHCRFLSGRDAARHLGDMTAADDDRVGIFLPDVYASEFFYQEERGNYISTMAYMRMINDLQSVEIESYDLLFACFVVLHEYGHWLHFRRCRKSGLDYVLWLDKHLAPVERQRMVLDMIPDAEPLKEELVVEHINAYNAMPQEFSANKYALKRVGRLYRLVLAHCGREASAG